MMDGRRDTWEESADYFRGYEDGRFDALKENEYKCEDSWRLGYADGKRDAAERIDDPVLKDIISGKGLLPIYAIDETPPADVEKVRHGRWIWTGAGKENPPYCSECEREAKWCEDYGFLTEDYCPYCGARMDGKE